MWRFIEKSDSLTRKMTEGTLVLKYNLSADCSTNVRLMTIPDAKMSIHAGLLGNKLIWHRI